VAAEVLALFAGGLHEGEALEEEDGEDAGHQVEDDAAEEGKADARDDGDVAGCGALPRARSRRRGAGPLPVTGAETS
jgi:hypothetical protein